MEYVWYVVVQYINERSNGSDSPEYGSLIRYSRCKKKVARTKEKLNPNRFFVPSLVNTCHENVHASICVINTDTMGRSKMIVLETRSR